MDASELKAYAPIKRVALIACLVHKAQMRVRDDLVLMFCKRIATKVKRAKEELEEIRLAEREMTEALIGNYRTVLKNIDDDGPAQAALAKAAAMTAEAVKALEGLDEEAPPEEVARRLDGKVSPAVLAWRRLCWCRPTALARSRRPWRASAGSPGSTSRSRRSPPITATSGRCCCTDRSAGIGR
ncbi:hypothetical protein [Actinacidiphila sp. bgisy160]|uniref:hypothetical protein n=1 Tax=Actinacidiphila sp. bgisy160 TaxID=3413796 RepID=UPI003D75F654